MPNPLIIEGMAQTAGILVGHANGFREKVILAKVNSAVLTREATPGVTLRYTATLDRLDDTGAATTGVGMAAGSTGEEGHGLNNMRRRLREQGGELDIDSAPGAGTAST